MAFPVKTGSNRVYQSVHESSYALRNNVYTLELLEGGFDYIYGSVVHCNKQMNKQVNK